ncbi:MAG: hypothetical protein HC865_04775 [Cyanobacteria bacterium RU_5_0]|nr:hypothetical protein [Cyanobacteria bacterium RU_5_0]
MDWLFHTSLTDPALSLLAQATPTPSPTADELELIKQQMEFLKDANAALTTTFDRYIQMVQLTLATAGGIVGIVAILGTVLSIKSLRDFYSTLKQVDGKVREAVDQEVAVALRQDRRRLNRLEDILAREDIPDRITIDFVVPTPAPQRRPDSLTFLLKVLEHRGFHPEVRYEPDFQTPDAAQQRPNFAAQIVVLDLHHAGIDRNLDHANAAIRVVAEKILSQKSALIIYGSGQYDAVRDLVNQGEFCGVSNGPLSFVTRVLEAAYVVDAIRV